MHLWYVNDEIYYAKRSDILLADFSAVFDFYFC